MSNSNTNGGVGPLETGRVSISFPCSAEYVSIARLAILGVASRLSLSYDEVEDVRLAVGEACTHAVERASANGYKAPTNGGRGTITIIADVSQSELQIEVADDVPTGGAGSDVVDEEFADLDIDRQGLGELLMEILVDEVEVKTEPNGTSIRLVKRAPEASTSSVPAN
ncbi:MAG TPA: ATP-binding protein [Capsulimonadaceae bacterium]